MRIEKLGANLYRSLFAMLTLAVIAAGLATGAQAVTYRVIHSFDGTTDGSNPYGDLVADAAGNLYGTTSTGGPRNCSSAETTCGGTVFQLSKTSTGGWTRKVLHAFAGPDGASPQSGLVFDSAGNLYGTTFIGGVGCQSESGCGVVFKLSPTTSGGWTYSVILQFSDSNANGTLPTGNLIMDSAGNLYGTTLLGGNFENGGSGCGVVYELSHGARGWTETVLYTFIGHPDGCGPNGIVFDATGNLYTTTTSGGTSSNQICSGGYGCGSVIQLSPNSSGAFTETVLYSFSGGSDGNLPTGSLVLDNSGNLYGVTRAGGTSIGCTWNVPGCGVVFKLSNSSGGWKQTVIHTFQPTSSGAAGEGGGSPASNLTFDTAGNLYGTAPFGGRGNGVVFKLSPNSSGGWTESGVHAFSGGTGGELPNSGVIFDSAGNIFGTTLYGGSSTACPSRCGVVFEITP
ncbi:MAG TPA: choice-of-anchor tandem repeat GloVer-containing protein [Candidatus Sulfotelmatobacter sp.]|jgi:uncharacterized repeat protein (TIGR03803 family)